MRRLPAVGVDDFWRVVSYSKKDCLFPVAGDDNVKKARQAEHTLDGHGQRGRAFFRNCSQPQ